MKKSSEGKGIKVLKGKKISSYNPMSLSGLLISMDRICDSYLYRREAINTVGDDFTVDTVMSPGTFIWETGIMSKKFNKNDWVIVDEYKTKKQAEKKHLRWVKYMENNPQELTDININKKYKFNHPTHH
jgi:hypothetical protein